MDAMSVADPENANDPQEPVQRLSAKATRKGGVPLTEAEMEEAEAEAEAWARRVNSCCGGEES